MLSVKATAMVALLSTLAAVSIGAALKSRGSGPGMYTARTAPAAQAQPVASVTPVPPKPLVSREPDADELRDLASRRLLMPVQGYDTLKLRDNFDELRGGIRRHEALDIMAARGTPVVAVDDGQVTKLFRSVAGGTTIYQSDPSGKLVYYYAHLDRYAEGLVEGLAVKRGQVIGYVGSTGNAPANAPHLHFTIFLLGPERKWWKGKAVNPYPYLASR
jgi:murein DD-endopeptidase MepM/ murein hydrolase activator NlpD